MVWDAGSLQTRLYARRQLALPARVEVHPDHAEQLRFSFPDHQSKVSVIDVSEGGLGLLMSTFLPRQARLEIHIHLPAHGDAPPPAPKVLRGIVRRCAMMDVKPTYKIGIQYLDPDLGEIRDLVKLAEAECGVEAAADQPGVSDAPPNGGAA